MGCSVMSMQATTAAGAGGPWTACKLPLTRKPQCRARSLRCSTTSGRPPDRCGALRITAQGPPRAAPLHPRRHRVRRRRPSAVSPRGTKTRAAAAAAVHRVGARQQAGSRDSRVACVDQHILRRRRHVPMVPTRRVRLLPVDDREAVLLAEEIQLCRRWALTALAT